jgi:transposase-like protein
LEKSAVSEHFVEASRAKLKELMERRLDNTDLCALLIDATPFEGQQMVAALGIGQDGRKTILGIRQGATENATVVGELLGDLVNRGLDFTEPRLYILDGGKALTAAVRKHAGDSAAIQRCQVHIAGRSPRFPEGWNVPSRASPYEPGSLGSGMEG